MNVNPVVTQSVKGPRGGRPRLVGRGFQEVQGDPVGQGTGVAAPAHDEADAEDGAQGEGDAGADPGQAQRAEHDAHEVEDGAVDLDPGDGGLGEQGQRRQRRLPPEATVDLVLGPVNWRERVRLSESR